MNFDTSMEEVPAETPSNYTVNFTVYDVGWNVLGTGRYPVDVATMITSTQVRLHITTSISPPNPPYVYQRIWLIAGAAVKDIYGNPQRVTTAIFMGPTG